MHVFDLPPWSGRSSAGQLEPLARDLLGATGILDAGLLQDVELDLVEQFHLLFRH